MSRNELEIYLTDNYHTTGEYLFIRYPNFQVFRHGGKKKWFAVLMDIPREKLGLIGDGEISIVNLKCDPRLIGSFRMEPGIFPGWHMNKAIGSQWHGRFRGGQENQVSSGYELRAHEIIKRSLLSAEGGVAMTVIFLTMAVLEFGIVGK